MAALPAAVESAYIVEASWWRSVECEKGCHDTTDVDVRPRHGDRGLVSAEV